MILKERLKQRIARRQGQLHENRRKRLDQAASSTAAIIPAGGQAVATDPRLKQKQIETFEMIRALYEQHQQEKEVRVIALLCLFEFPRIRRIAE